MPHSDIAQRFDHLAHRLDVRDYNFDRFRTKDLASDFRATIESRGLRPGEVAPDLELPRVGDGSLRLSALRGQPVLLKFGSYT